MTKDEIRKYAKKWGGLTMNFLDMLTSKFNFARLTGNKVYAYNGLKTAEELETILIVAEDMAVSQ